MSPTDDPWVPILARLRALVGARVQKVSVRENHEVALTLYDGAKHAFSIDPNAGNASFGPPSADAPKRPKGAQGLLRKVLAKSALSAVETERAALVLRFGEHALVLERDQRDPRALILGAENKVLLVIGKVSAADGRDLRRGQTYLAPTAEVKLARPRDERANDAPDDALVRALRRERKRVARLIKNLARDLDKHGDADRWHAWGEALKMVLHDVKKGDRLAGEIPLDPRLSPGENLDRLFARARRAKSARARAAPRLEDARARLATIDALIANPVEQDARALLEERPELGGGARRRAASARRPFRTFRSSAGDAIMVGRSAKDSDRLTFHVARSDDLWLHARDTTGAHVIVRAEKNKEPARSTLEDAKLLAVWFSSRRTEAWDVQIARRRHVRKPGKGAAAGFVFVHKERVERAFPDEERRKALLATES